MPILEVDHVRQSVTAAECLPAKTSHCHEFQLRFSRALYIAATASELDFWASTNITQLEAHISAAPPISTSSAQLDAHIDGEID